MDAWRAPTRVISFHATDQHADFFADLRLAEPLGTQPPKQPKPNSVPGNNSVRLHDDQGISPAAPPVLECNAEQPVEAAQSGSRLLTLEDHELLAKTGGFQTESVLRDEVREGK